MDIEREFDDEGALSRDRDPAVPRGAVVAGEDRELEVVGWRTRARAGDGYVDCALGPWELHYSEPARNPLNYDKEPLTPLLPAQERIRALEARLEQGVVERRLKESALARGAVVAGEQRGLEGAWQERAERLEALAKFLMVALAALDPDPDAVRENLDIKRLLEWAAEVESTCDLKESVYTYAIRILDSPRPTPAQERIRALEEAGRELAELHAETRRRWQELEVRLERVRGVVRAAVKWQGKTPATRWADGGVSLLDAVDALTPEDREWAEGEEEG